MKYLSSLFVFAALAIAFNGTSFAVEGFEGQAAPAAEAAGETGEEAVESISEEDFFSDFYGEEGAAAENDAAAEEAVQE